METSEFPPPLVAEVAAARVDLSEPEASTSQPASSNSFLDPWLSVDTIHAQPSASEPSPAIGHLPSLSSDDELLGRAYSASDQPGLGGLLSNLMNSNANSWGSPATSAPQLEGDTETAAPGQEAAGNVASSGREDSPGRDDSRSQSQVRIDVAVHNASSTAMMSSSRTVSSRSRECLHLLPCPLNLIAYYYAQIL